MPEGDEQDIEILVEPITSIYGKMLVIGQGFKTNGGEVWEDIKGYAEILYQSTRDYVSNPETGVVRADLLQLLGQVDSLIAQSSDSAKLNYLNYYRIHMDQMILEAETLRGDVPDAENRLEMLSDVYERVYGKLPDRSKGFLKEQNRAGVETALRITYEGCEGYLTGQTRLENFPEMIDFGLGMFDTLIGQLDPEEDFAEHQFITDMKASIKLMYEAVKGTLTLEQVDQISQIPAEALDIERVKNLQFIDEWHEHILGMMHNTEVLTKVLIRQVIDHEGSVYKAAKTIRDSANDIEIYEACEQAQTGIDEVRELRRILSDHIMLAEAHHTILGENERVIIHGQINELEQVEHAMIYIYNAAQGLLVDSAKDERLTKIKEYHDRVQYMLGEGEWPDNEPMSDPISEWRREVIAAEDELYEAAKKYVAGGTAERSYWGREMAEKISEMDKMIKKVNDKGYNDGREGAAYTEGVMMRRIKGAMLMMQEEARGYSIVKAER